MYGVLFSSILILLLGYLFNQNIENNIYLTLLFMFMTMIVLFFTIMRRDIKFALIIFISMFIRLFLLFVDLFYKQIKIIPHSGGDTENFYASALSISNNIYLMGETVYGGVYSKFLGFILYIYGDDRLFLQYLNILFAVISIMIVIEIFKKLNISKKIQLYLVFIMAFFPHSLIFSSILLRESLITFLVVLSVYFYISWYKNGKKRNVLISIVLILSAASFHSAVIGIIIGYLFGFIFYKQSKQKWQFSIQSIVPFCISAFFIVYTIIFPEAVLKLPFFNKFSGLLLSDDKFYEIASGSGKGGSAYLSGMEINNLFQLILYSPIKMIYFFSSPMPWDIRNFNDIVSFFLDASFYIIAFIIVMKNSKNIKKNPLLLILIISLITSLFILGVGISNAGTALRHRFKLFYIIVIILSMIFEFKKRRK